LSVDNYRCVFGNQTRLSSESLIVVSRIVSAPKHGTYSTLSNRLTAACWSFSWPFSCSSLCETALHHLRSRLWAGHPQIRVLPARHSPPKLSMECGWRDTRVCRSVVRRRFATLCMATCGTCTKGSAVPDNGSPDGAFTQYGAAFPQKRGV
jgi:hypothetical protein